MEFVKTIEQVNIDKLIPYARNARIHSDNQISEIAGSIKEFGFINPILVSQENIIIAGHGRLAAAQLLGLLTVPVIKIPHLSKIQQRALVLADNRIPINASWDVNMLAVELDSLQEENFDVKLLGFDTNELTDLLNNEPGEQPDILDSEQTDNKQLDGMTTTEIENHLLGPQDKNTPSLADRFGVPPFSLLDSRLGRWRDRKKFWNELIGDMGESRERTLFSPSDNPVSNVMENINTVSVFDAVLAEIIVRWFGVPGGLVVDPFAGDTVFGFVAGTLGMAYQGIEIRKEQVELNQARIDKQQLPCKYYQDTSLNMDLYFHNNLADLVFTCPPYANLEKYSDDPLDLSAMSIDRFFETYCRILSKTFLKLKNNRFAVIVVGEVRDSKGKYIGLVHRTIMAMQQAGYSYYNEMILATQIATVRLRAADGMTKSRKIGKVHQNVLVFVKGDPKIAVQDMGDIVNSMQVDDDLQNGDAK